MVQIRINRNLTGIEARLSQMVGRGQHAFVNQVYADANIYAPMKSSDLRNQSQIASDGKSIVWNTPYARRQYYNQFVNYSTPGTGPKWVEKAKSIHLESWLRVAKAAMR